MFATPGSDPQTLFNPWNKNPQSNLISAIPKTSEQTKLAQREMWVENKPFPWFYVGTAFTNKVGFFKASLLKMVNLSRFPPYI